MAAQLDIFRGPMQVAEDRAAQLEAELAETTSKLAAAAAARADLATKVLALQSRNAELTKALKCTKSKSLEVVSRKRVVASVMVAPQQDEGLCMQLGSAEQEIQALKKALEAERRLVEQGAQKLRRVESERDTLKRVLLVNDAEKAGLEESIRELTQELRFGGVDELEGVAKAIVISGEFRTGDVVGLLRVEIGQLKDALAAAEERASESEAHAEELLETLLPRLAALEAFSEKIGEVVKEIFDAPTEPKGLHWEAERERLCSEVHKEVDLLKSVSKAMGSALVSARAQAHEQALVLAQQGVQCGKLVRLVWTSLGLVQAALRSMGQGHKSATSRSMPIGRLKQHMLRLRQQLALVAVGGTCSGVRAPQLVMSKAGVKRKACERVMSPVPGSVLQQATQQRRRLAKDHLEVMPTIAKGT